MLHLGELLRGLDLPAAHADGPVPPADESLLHDLGGDLPAGHLHLWGGPPGAGKTAFLLSLLLGAAGRGRRVVYATYHLPADGLARRLLAMAASLDHEALSRGDLSEVERRRAAAMRETLSRLPVSFLEARGFTVPSLEDRLVRIPFRPEVVAVDYLQAVARGPGEELGDALKAFASLASRLHVAVVCALQGSAQELGGFADRAGWLAPAGGSGLRRAEIIRNRYGARPAVPLRIDPGTGVLRRVHEELMREGEAAPPR